MLQIVILLLLIRGGVSQQINFAGSPANVDEDAGTITFSLVASAAVGADTPIEIRQQTTSTAAARYDFGGSGTYTVTMAMSMNSIDLVLSINNDALVELAETIVLEIITVTGAATVGTGLPTATGTINVDVADSAKVRVDFEVSQYVTDEQTSPVTVVLQFTDPSGQPTVLNGLPDVASFTLPTSGSTDTATVAGTDFGDPTAAPITFPIDKTMTSLSRTITIADDATVEFTEDFHLSLGTFMIGTYVQLGVTRPVTNIRIRDNDYETMTCVARPEYNRRSRSNFELYAFTSLAANRASIAWSKTNLKNLNPGTLANQGTYGKKLTVPRAKRSGRRFGAYMFTATGTSMAALSCNAFIRTQSAILMHPAAIAKKYTMIIYPTAFGSTDLCPTLTFGIDYDTPRTRRKLKWTKDGKPINNFDKCQRTVKTTDAAGIYTISRDNRGKAWFAIIELKLAVCPEKQYRMGGACVTCPECFNGGVCAITDAGGPCICPPCFEGQHCELVATDGGGFGLGKRFSCAADLGADATCKGLLFGYGDLYGSSCGCGWSGTNCTVACKVGTFGADCSQTCHCMTPARCDIRTGVCVDAMCATGYGGDNCQKN